MRGINLDLLPEDVFLSFLDENSNVGNFKLVVVERDENSILFRPISNNNYAIHTWQYFLYPLNPPYNSFPYVKL